ncbi:MAG TPA: hypothetical protein VM684_07350, partial [Gaiellales bacterium]|nr:hypothetical protein [Gaiellales bacterium]
ATTKPTTKAAARRRESEIAAHSRAECALRDHPALGRWLRQGPSGRLVLDTAKIRAEARLDGKYLLVTSDPDLTAEDVALGYKNLLEAETSKPRCCHSRGWALPGAPSWSGLSRAA